MTALARDFLGFVNRSPSPFHAVHTASEFLLQQGYKKLIETEPWNLIPGGKFFFTRNQSCLVAFTVGKKYQTGNGFNIIAAHTDSPCLKIKPRSKLANLEYQQIGVECYGGGLWHTWFDRDLSVCGRVIVKESDKFVHRLVRVERPICRIPSLAIHLAQDFELKFNKENHLVPIMAAEAAKQLTGATDVPNSDRHSPELLNLIAKELGTTVDNLRDFELCLYDTQPASLGGINEDLIYSSRLDNLMSCYSGLKALEKSDATLEDESAIRLLALFDHEEVGSQSAVGACSALLQDSMARICSSLNSNDPNGDHVSIMKNKSFILSCDMAHAVHPNYSDKHEKNHQPKMHKGVVIKTNSNQRYATNSIGTTILRELGAKRGVPLQDFVVRNDGPCGSTVGPILSANLGVRALDIGIPQLSMHSIREVCGAADVEHYVRLMTAFFEDFSSLDCQFAIDA
eukprot:TRINITY_DN1810_c0_g1::TRINITY_DN1810_c0_g1_i1::g.14066::m.14066 TRINITY_DN1810_c0_g1::TRINITY_DN1810_c0_g1_i1::g.14066  ORF type:complete len:472 (-),score=102.78,sp/B9RAJ0/DNPEP_RICCO/48.34/2e-162,Peptidase_M18/PF02127.10/3.1e-160,Peptidase_M42/PF05343.9/4.6,Peptidase_M42/PF05343.9/2.7e-06 TRINITY_DN1810_c0_g1_i1:268-1635(-)